MTRSTTSAIGLVETVDLGEDDSGVILTKNGRDLLDSHTLKREENVAQAFHAGVSRPREIDHDSNLYATYRQEESRLRDEHGDLEIRRVVLEQDLKREYQEFLKTSCSSRKEWRTTEIDSIEPRNGTTFQLLGAV